MCNLRFIKRINNILFLYTKLKKKFQTYFFLKKLHPKVMSLSFILSGLDKIFSHYEIRGSQTQILLQQNKNALNHKKIVEVMRYVGVGCKLQKPKKIITILICFFCLFVCWIFRQTPKKRERKRKKERKKFLRS
jgi:hypothetical protein